MKQGGAARKLDERMRRKPVVKVVGGGLSRRGVACIGGEKRGTIMREENDRQQRQRTKGSGDEQFEGKLPCALQKDLTSIIYDLVIASYLFFGGKDLSQCTRFLTFPILVLSCLVSLECTLWEGFFWRMPKQAYTVPCRASPPRGQGAQVLCT